MSLLVKCGKNSKTFQLVSCMIIYLHFQLKYLLILLVFRPPNSFIWWSFPLNSPLLVCVYLVAYGFFRCNSSLYMYAPWTSINLYIVITSLVIIYQLFCGFNRMESHHRELQKLQAIDSSPAKGNNHLFLRWGGIAGVERIIVFVP